MKLFAFVRRARRPPTSPAPAPAAVPEDAAPVEKRRRRPSSSSSSSGSAPWKPTLVSISEDAAVTAAAAGNKAQAKPAAKAKARPPLRATRAASHDDFRHYGPPMVLPAFTPTAFLF